MKNRSFYECHRNCYCLLLLLLIRSAQVTPPPLSTPTNTIINNSPLWLWDYDGAMELRFACSSRSGHCILLVTPQVKMTFLALELMPPKLAVMTSVWHTCVSIISMYIVYVKWGECHSEKPIMLGQVHSLPLCLFDNSETNQRSAYWARVMLAFDVFLMTIRQLRQATYTVRHICNTTGVITWTHVCLQNRWYETFSVMDTAVTITVSDQVVLIVQFSILYLLLSSSM